METLFEYALEKGLLALAVTLGVLIFRERTFYLDKKDWKEEKDFG